VKFIISFKIRFGEGNLFIRHFGKRLGKVGKIGTLPGLHHVVLQIKGGGLDSFFDHVKILLVHLFIHNLLLDEQPASFFLLELRIIQCIEIVGHHRTVQLSGFRIGKHLADDGVRLTQSRISIQAHGLVACDHGF